jgi:hypothetical protein
MFSCSVDSETPGVFQDLFGTSSIMMQFNVSTVQIDVFSSFFPSLSSRPLSCSYSECELMDDIDCSSFLSGFSNCVRCNRSSCSHSLNQNLHFFSNWDDFGYISPSSLNGTGVPYYQEMGLFNPYVYLFQELGTPEFPSIFGCQTSGKCFWSHVEFNGCVHLSKIWRSRPCNARSAFVCAIPRHQKRWYFWNF